MSAIDAILTMSVGIFLLLLWNWVNFGRIVDVDCHGRGPKRVRVPIVRVQRHVELAVSVAITMVVLAAALYVVLSRDPYPDATQKWAFGAIGTIFGFWFKKNK